MHTSKEGICPGSVTKLAHRVKKWFGSMFPLIPSANNQFMEPWKVSWEIQRRDPRSHWRTEADKSLECLESDDLEAWDNIKHLTLHEVLGLGTKYKGAGKNSIFLKFKKDFGKNNAEDDEESGML